MPTPTSVFAAALVAVAVLAPTAPSYADPTCSLTDAGFCLTSTYQLTDAGSSGIDAAGEPVTMVLSLTNTSSDLTTNPNHWVKSLDITLGQAGAAPVLTPSADLPDGSYLVGGAGSEASCAPTGTTYSSFSCPVGVGSGLVSIAGVGPNAGALNALLGTAPYPVTFGIASLVNSNPSGGPAHTWDYVARLRMTVAGLPILGDYTSDLMSVPVTGDAGGTGLARLTMLAPAPFDLSFPVPIVGSVDGHFVPALNAASLTIPGRDTADAHTVLANPRTCFSTPAQGVATVTDQHNDAVDVPLSIGPITGCPSTPSLTTSGSPNAVSASALSTTALGRTLDHYRWTFGDGQSLNTPTGATTHTYSSAAPRTVTVTGVDDFGAVSTTTSKSLRGTKLTAAQKRLTVRGRAVDYSSGAGLSGRAMRLYRCPAATTPLSSCTLWRSTTTTANGGYTFRLPTLTRNANALVTSGGDGSRIGAQRRLTLKPQPVVSLNRSATAVKRGHAVRLYGAVKPDEHGKTVRLQRQAGSHWTTVASRALGSKSTYSFTVHPSVRGTTAYRVLRPASSTNLVGTSAVRRVKVS